MFNEWLHPKTGEKRLYVARRYLRPVADLHGITAREIKAWFTEPQVDDLPELSVLVQALTPPSGVNPETLKQDILEALELDKPTWAQLAALIDEPEASGPDLADEPDLVEEDEAARQDRRVKRITEASKLDLSRVRFKASVTIEVDHRETKLMTTLLQEHPEVTILRAHLDVADYRIKDAEGNELLVERKRCTYSGQQKTDFENEVQSGARLFEQSERLKFIAANSDHQIIPILLLEGDVHTNSGSMLVQQIDGALSFLAAVHKLSIWSTHSARHSAYTLLKLASHFQEGTYALPKSNHGPKPKVLFDQKLHLLESLPGVSSVIAEALLAEFGSVAKVMQATEQQLAKVKGVGPKTSRSIFRVIN